jgi:acetyl esterase/lipase
VGVVGVATELYVVFERKVASSMAGYILSLPKTYPRGMRSARNGSFGAGLCGILMLATSAIPSWTQAAIKAEGVVFRVVNGKELKLDVERPTPEGSAKPAVVFLCGNGWGYSKTFDRTEFAYGLDLAAARGYVGVTVDYSSTRANGNDRPIGVFPAQVYDVKSAIRFLRANAKRFDIDPDRIGVVGHSSGGNLALMLGLTRPTDGLEGKDEYLQYSSAVQAVVNFAGPTELVSDYLSTPEVDSAYVGGTPEAVPDNYRMSSPITYVRPNAPPILTMHGDKDVASSIRQALLLDDKMREVGGLHTLIIKKGAGHMDFSLAEPAVWEFLARVLRN